MAARIYKPAQNVMQQGKGATREWVLEYVPTQPRVIEPLMGWTSSGDTRRQVRINFATKEEAIAFARAEGYRRIVLWTVSGLAVAARSYAAAGFVRTRLVPARRWGRDVVEELHELELA